MPIYRADHEIAGTYLSNREESERATSKVIAESHAIRTPHKKTICNTFITFSFFKIFFTVL